MARGQIKSVEPDLPVLTINGFTISAIRVNRKRAQVDCVVSSLDAEAANVRVTAFFFSSMTAAAPFAVVSWVGDGRAAAVAHRIRSR